MNLQLSLYYPIKPIHINQLFGNPSPTYTAMGLQGHNGVDLAAIHGRPVYASHDGDAYYEIDASGGHGVVITTSQPFNYNGKQVYFKTIYWHLCDSSKEPQFKSPLENYPQGVGRTVKAGDLIGYADNTGVSTGSHLHLGLKPMAIGEPPGTWYNVEQTNGYLGAIDPTPYFNGLYAEDLHPQKYQFTANFGIHSLRFQDVYNLQKLLVAGGFGTFSPTGFFGGLTQQAVENYQKAHGIEQTGFVGPLTRASLNQ